MEKNYIDFLKVRIVRVVSKYNNWVVPDSYGSGFFINKTDLLTCAHVVMGGDYRNLIDNNPDLKLLGNDEEKIIKYIKKKTFKFQIEFNDKTNYDIFLKSIDLFNDIALLRLSNGRTYDSYFEFDNSEITYGQEVNFCGYQNTPEYTVDKNPFTFNSGIISSFVDTTVAGSKYTHLQINSINLGGNSGAPLLKSGSRKVCGIVNGIQRYGANNLAMFNMDGSLIKGEFNVPIGIAYATEINRIIKHSLIKKYF